MKRLYSIFLLAALIIGCFGGCGSGDDQFLSNYQPGGESTLPFMLQDANHTVLNGVFWSATGVGYENEDNDNPTCVTPDASTPQVANGDADQDGCTSGTPQGIIGQAVIHCNSFKTFTIHVDNGAGRRDSKSVLCDPNAIFTFGLGLPVIFEDF